MACESDCFLGAGEEGALAEGVAEGAGGTSASDVDGAAFTPIVGIAFARTVALDPLWIVAPEMANKATLAKAALGNHMCEVGFAVGTAMATGLEVDPTDTSAFSDKESRSRSAMTSRMISTSIDFLFIAQPKESALKQRLLTLRGIPSLCSAISPNAAGVNRGLSERYPADASLWLMYCIVSSVENGLK